MKRFGLSFMFQYKMEWSELYKIVSDLHKQIV